MRNMMLIIRNTLSVTFRKKGNIIVYLFLPLLGVLVSLLIYGNSEQTTLRVGIENKDTGVFSQDLKSSLEESKQFKLSEVTEDAITKQLLDMKLDVVIEIPAGYTESIYKGEPLKLGVVSVKGQDTTVWIEQRLNSYTGELKSISVASAGNRALFDQIYDGYKSDMVKLSVVSLEDTKSSKGMALSSVGFLIMFVMLGAGFISMVILKEKRDRTYHRICSAPVHARQYIAGNAITSMLIVIAQIIMIQLFMKYVFRIDTGISDLSLFVILLLFGFVAVGVGLVVTAFSSSSYMASTLSTLIITPTCMLGGCFWDMSQASSLLQKVGYFVPQRWAMNAISRLQSGATMSDVAVNLLIMAAFAAALFLIAIYKFARTNNLQKFV